MSMLNMHGWVECTCEESDELRQNMRPFSALTDPDGLRGCAVIFTEWATEEGVPVLRDYRWTGEPCSHYKRADDD